MEESRHLKRSRSAAKGQITKVKNEIQELLLDVKNIVSINEKLPALNDAVVAFEAAHEKYHANLTDECDIEESNEYFEAEMTRIHDLRRRIELLAVAKEQIDDRSSVSSRRSSRSDTRSKAAAKRASLKAEASLLKKRQSLQEEEFRLKMKMEQLKLETELAKAVAEEKAYDSESSYATNSDDQESDSDEEDLPTDLKPTNNVKPPTDMKQIDNVKPSTDTSQIDKAEPSTDTKQSAERKPTVDLKDSKPLNIKTESNDTLLNVTAQQSQTQQLDLLLMQQQRHTLALMLPQPQVPTFSGDPLSYCSFIRAFESLIETKTTSDSTRLYYLIQYTKGDVQELMQSCLMMSGDEGYKEARRQLKQRYGQDYHIATAYVNKLSEYEPMKNENVESLRRFSTLLTSCRNTLKELGYSNKLGNPDSMRRIVDKLPYGIRLKWRDVADAISEKKHREITIDDLASFVEDRARVAAHPIFGNVSGDTKTNTKGKSPTRRATSFATSTDTQERVQRIVKCPSCQQGHWLSQCQTFRAMSLDERHKLVRDKSLCDNCLTPGHIASACTKSSFCKVDGCTQKHSTFLHPKSYSNKGVQRDSTTSNVVNQQAAQDSARNGYVKGRAATRLREVTALPIVPVNVRVQGSDMVVQTYAFLDGGSNTTFCTEKLKDMLKATGSATTLSITTIEKVNSKTETTVMNLQVSTLDGTKQVDLPTVYSITRLPVSNESIAHEVDVNKWPHLRDLNLQSIEADVGLLIGSDVPQALQPLDVKGGLDGEPYAMRTALGWSIVGPLTRGSTIGHVSNFVQADVNLETQFKQYCNMEFKDALYDEKKTMSMEDKRAIKMMEQTVKLKDGHYELSLPWKHESPNLDNNRCLALHRLSLLKKRLSRDPKFHQMYKEFIEKLLKNGHARKIVDDGPAGKIVWYLPHHPVFHPKKPDKVRVVYDCAAKFKGNSLNSELLQGPDLTNSLIGVLTRFREEPVALMADIEAMFYQVHVTEDDRDALRFLWFKDGDLNADVEEFQMNVHLFGGASSPSCANFALRKTADDNAGEFSTQAIETVKKNFYVDDCLKSVATERAAVNLADELRSLLAKGGFRLTKWMSNSTAVISSIPEEERAPSVKSLDFDSVYVERALGVQWNVSSDTFGFSITIKDKPATRRGILSTVSSIYDPLGFVAPFTLPAKMLLQDLCRQKLGWDDPIASTDLQRWQAWLQELPHLEGLAINRCFKPSDFGDVKSAQLHNFSDASQLGYGGVTYLRLVNQDERIHCAFVHGKSRLAPLKSVTIPRLELSAAVLSTRLNQMAQKELSTQMTEESVYWTDSTCVLAYINNDDKRFQTFVANRIAAIHEKTTTDQWRYVDTSSNPADDASRGLLPHAALDTNRWLNGPDFLWKSEENWPQPPNAVKLPDDDPEVKKEATVSATVTTPTYDVMALFQRFSDWTRLRKFVAWMLRLKSNLRSVCSKRRNKEAIATISKPTSITVEEINTAEREILKQVQLKSFADEIDSLSSSNPSVRRSSSIYNLSPRLKDGLLCVGGRLANAPVDDQQKHQLILPTKSHVVEMIIRHYHINSGHSGVEYVLSQLRERFWIVRARVTVRQILGACFLCRKRHGKTQEQKMADLPKDRVTPDNPPFTSVGIDFFGPFQVRRGRTTVKRYGVLYTCLTTRAVHIEVAHGLDTDSFINSLRRFIARRGPPKEFRTDNGTNFVGGERELREAVQAFNQTAIHEALLQKNIRWTFNPPAGSHHGGVWERCIRSTRKILNALLNEQTIYDETLSTLLCEVEMVMNGRPLTKVSDDPRDLEALTPNHLLLLRPGATLPPGVFDKDDTYSRRRWRQVQYLADVFWRRWVKEYLPTLQSRQKWVEKRRNLQPNDIVLIVDNTTARSDWPLARVLEVYQNSKDGLVRSAKVQTRTSVLVRPVSKIVLLEEADTAA